MNRCEGNLNARSFHANSKCPRLGTIGARKYGIQAAHDCGTACKAIGELYSLRGTKPKC